MIYIQFAFKQPQPQDAFSCIYVRTFQKALMLKMVKIQIFKHIYLEE